MDWEDLVLGPSPLLGADAVSQVATYDEIDVLDNVSTIMWSKLRLNVTLLGLTWDYAS